MLIKNIIKKIFKLNFTVKRDIINLNLSFSYKNPGKPNDWNERDIVIIPAILNRLKMAIVIVINIELEYKKKKI